MPNGILETSAHTLSPTINHAHLLSILRCPETGEKLIEIDEETLKTQDTGRTWPIVNGRPVFIPEGRNVTIHPDTHLSHQVGDEESLRLLNENGLVLHLSAGGSARRYPNAVELEYSIFRNTDVVGDVHKLPFQDDVFDGVLCINAFEHYREPERAMDEIRRVLKSGGRLVMMTAFLQPLHEAPHHYYNCTEYGLRQWLRHFNVERLDVSWNFNPAFAISWLASEIEFAFRNHVSNEAADTFADTRLGDIAAFWRDPESRNSAIWNFFHQLPAAVQKHFSAGWQAVARK